MLSGSHRLTFAAIVGILFSAPLLAQGVQEIPNAMAVHTTFIIGVTTIFLIWAVSFSIQTMKERTNPQQQRQVLLERRERILEEITKIEMARESGDITRSRYNRRLKTNRGDLVRVIEKLQSSARARKKRA